MTSEWRLDIHLDYKILNQNSQSNYKTPQMTKRKKKPKSLSELNPHSLFLIIAGWEENIYLKLKHGRTKYVTFA